ncbi:MAG TPA: hypothetical protein VHE83_05430 [Mycobacteriales bacterium]|nr:hypothetical protein [Mycobacteriales bacterium]
MFVGVPVATGTLAGASAACAPDAGYVVTPEGHWYAAMDSPVGEYNSSTQTSSLHYDFTTDHTRTSAWEESASVSAGWAIAKIEASTKYTVTSSVSSGKSVGTTFPVPAKDYGYVQPKVEYRSFDISYGHYSGSCAWVTTSDYGTFDAITAWPFFATCVGKSACTPKP